MAVLGPTRVRSSLSSGVNMALCPDVSDAGYQGIGGAGKASLYKNLLLPDYPLQVIRTRQISTQANQELQQ